MLVSDVVTRVERQFGDEASVQINEADIIRWVNDAVREISTANDLTQATGTMNSVVGTNTYDFPSDLMSIRAIYYDNQKLQSYSKAEYDEYINESDPNEVQSGTPFLYTRWGGSFVLYPKPDSVKVIKLLYLQLPGQLGDTAAIIPLPDIYFNRVVEYCLQQAYQTDEDWEAATQMSGQFEDGLMKLKERETATNVEYYPSITVLPDDAGYY